MVRASPLRARAHVWMTELSRPRGHTDDPPRDRRRGLHRLGGGPPADPRDRRGRGQCRQADLRRQPRLAGRGGGRARATTSSASTSSTPRRSARVFEQYQPDGGDPPGGRVARRSLDRRARRVHPDQRRRDVHPARRGDATTGSRPATTRRRDFRFLHVSTDEVFGSLGPQGYFTEETPYRPNSPYSASKAASDHLVRAWHHTYGLPTLVTNCSNNYGPYQFPEKLIPLMIFNALEGKPLPVYGAGRQRPRLALRRGPRPRPARRCWRRGDPARPTTSAGTTRRPTWRSSTPSAGCWTSCARTRRTSRTLADHLRQRPPRARPPLRHRRRQDRPRAGLAPARRLRVGPAQDRASGTWRTPAGARRGSASRRLPGTQRLGLGSDSHEGHHPRRRHRGRGSTRSPRSSASNCCRSTTSR